MGEKKKNILKTQDITDNKQTDKARETKLQQLIYAHFPHFLKKGDSYIC